VTLGAIVLATRHRAVVAPFLNSPAGGGVAAVASMLSVACALLLGLRPSLQASRGGLFVLALFTLCEALVVALVRLARPQQVLLQHLNYAPCVPPGASKPQTRSAVYCALTGLERVLGHERDPSRGADGRGGPRPLALRVAAERGARPLGPRVGTRQRARGAVLGGGADARIWLRRGRSGGVVRRGAPLWRLHRV